MKLTHSQRKQIDLVMMGVLLGSAMTFGLMTLGFTVYRDTKGVNRYERVSSVPEDYLPNPPYVTYIEQVPPLTTQPT